VETVDLGGGMKTALGHIFGSYQASGLLLLTVLAPNGARWVYVQPYSMSAALPGEHHFVLAGTPTAPLLARGPGWFSRNFRLRMVLSTFLLLSVFGAPLAVALLVFFPRPPKLDGGPEAVSLNASSAVRRQVFANRFGIGNFILPWVIQVYGMGEGRSRLVCRAPSTCVRRIVRPPVADFAWAAELAGAVQSQLTSHHVARQAPRVPLGYTTLVDDWEPSLRAMPLPVQVEQPSRALPSGAPGAAAQTSYAVAERPSGPSAWTTWVPLGLGLCLAGVGFLLVLGGIAMVVDPDTPKQVESGWAGIIFSFVVCVAPSLAVAAFGGVRLGARFRAASASTSA
jgi:hypothetical protein